MYELSQINYSTSGHGIVIFVDLCRGNLNFMIVCQFLAQSHEPHQTAQPLTTSSSEPLPSTSEPVQGQNTESQSNSSGVNKTGINLLGCTHFIAS